MVQLGRIARAAGKEQYTALPKGDEQIEMFHQGKAKSGYIPFFLLTP